MDNSKSMPLHSGRVRGGKSIKVSGTPESRVQKSEADCTMYLREKCGGHPFSKDVVKKL